MGEKSLLNSFIVFTLVSVAIAQNNKIFMGPSRSELRTSCKEFSRFARFNPNSVVGKWWFVFYHWRQPPSSQYFYFRIPTSDQDAQLHRLLDGKVTVPVDWSARRVLLTDLHNKTELLVEQNDRGIYHFYALTKDVRGLVEPVRLQLKQVANGRYIGLLNCEDAIAYVMSAADDVPGRREVHAAAATIGYREPRGRSYLYKGHEWMPVDDDDLM